jgi:hypothetical protein
LEVFVHSVETDWSLSWLTDVLDALHGAQKNLEERNRRCEWFDGLFLLEHLEEVYGVAFVAAQTYITRTVADLGKACSGDFAANKDELLRRFGSRIPRTAVTSLELVYHLANYYKHHADWPNWESKGIRRHTVVTLKAVSITRDTDFPCVRGMELLDRKRVGVRSALKSHLSGWRKHVIQYYQSEGFFEK